MDTLKDDAGNDILWRLTAHQKQQIYEQEKERMERIEEMKRLEGSRFLFSKKTNRFIAFYLLGCVLIYFGIAQSFIEFWGTGQWRFEPEKGLPLSLFNAAWELARPLAAGFFVMMFGGIVWGLWALVSDLPKYLRKLTNRNNKQG